jgi:hypothetical protein
MACISQLRQELA